MPFLEFLISIIVIAIGLVFLAGGAALMAGTIVSILGVAILTGWIPILMCASDASYAIGFSQGFVGSWAAIATIAYVLSSVGIVALWFIKPDPDGLPPAWKFLSNFYTYKPAATAKSSIHSANRNWDTQGFSDSVERGAPNWGHHKATSASQMREQAGSARKEADRLRRENDKRATEIREASDLAEAMMDLEREKARREGFKETSGR